ncbi:MAG: carboxysome shell protein, partial [Synechococcus sp. SB0666_bin_14]|nr:carboxysome shell protein [Synechococcus sp. SB0666_bin_14]
MPARRDPYQLLGPTAPRRRPPRRDGRSPVDALASPGLGTAQPAQPVAAMGPLHPLTNRERNQWLWTYDNQVKSSFDKIVEVLKRISALQHEPDFEQKAQALAMDAFGFSLPEDVLAKAWVTQLDMRSLFAWCVF